MNLSVCILIFLFFQENMERTKNKTVRFDDCVKVRKLCVWNYAYRQCRKTYWMTVAVDRCRFERRIQDGERILNPILIEKYEEFKK